MFEIGLIGLLAGEGTLPVEFAKKAADKGLRVLAIGVTQNTHPDIVRYVTEFLAIPITQWGQVVHAFTSRGVERVYVLGSVSKQALYSGAPMDERFMSVLQAARDGRDNQLFLAFAQDLAQSGITICEQMELLPELTTGPGVLTKRQLTPEEERDVEFAFRMAKGVAGLDIGQTVVVKKQSVLAVEAIDGTNETLRRGAMLGKGDVVAVKVTKPDQDLRFDLPTIGTDTLRTMAECGVRVLAFEAHRTILLDKDQLKALADAADITLVAIEPGLAEGESPCAS